MQLELARVDQALGEGRSRGSNNVTSRLSSFLGWLSFLLKPFLVEGEKVNYSRLTCRQCTIPTERSGLFLGGSRPYLGPDIHWMDLLGSVLTPEPTGLAGQG